MKNFICYLLFLTTVWGFMATSALGQNCPMNTNINSTTNPNGTTVSWNTVAGALQYELRFREVGTSALSYASTTTNSFTFTNLQSNVCYEYAVRTICDSINIGPWSRGQSFCVAGSSGFCAMPSNIVSTPMTNSAALNWTAVAGAQTYEIRYRKIGTSALSYATSSTNSLVLNGLMPSTCYEFAMRTGCDTSNYSPWTMPARNFCTTAPAQPCTTPINVSASTSPNAVLLTWTASSNAVGYEIRYRKVGTSALSYATTAVNRISINNLMANTCYEYSIRTQCDSSDFSPWLIPAQNFCIPGATGFCATPTNITSTTTATTTTLNWMAMANAKGYEIRYRKIGTSALSYVYPNSNSTVLSGLMPNTCYEFSIRTACDTSSFSPWLIPAQSFCTDSMTNMPCMMPTNLTTATTTSTSATVSWSATNANHGYEVRYGNINSSNFTTFQTFNTMPTLQNLQPGACYFLSVRAVCDSVNNVFSALTDTIVFCTDSITLPPCSLPSTLNDSVGGPTYTLLYWSGVAGSQGYEIRYREVGTTALTYVVSGGNSEGLFNLTPGTCYEYSIRTICDSVAGNYSPWLTPAQTFCTDPLPCATPTNVMEDSVTSNMAFISWSGSSSASFGYEVRYKLFSSGSYNYVSTNSPAAVIGNLAADSCYIFSVRAVCDTLASNYSSWANDDIFCTNGPVGCGTPSNIILDTVGNYFAFFYWDSVANANNYLVRYRQANTNMPYMYDTTIFNNYGNYNLAANTCYEFEFQTMCSTGNSTWSTIQSFCTDSTSFNCARPTNTFMVINPTFGRFNWNRIVGAAGYEVRFRLLGSNNAYTTLYATDTTRFYQGFQANTCYEYNVRTQCDTFLSPSGQYTYSFWSIQDSFCTPSMLVSGSDNATTVDDFQSVTKGNENTPIRYTLFPNPTTGQVTIKFEQALTTEYTVRVFNVLGAEVTPATNRSGGETCTLNLSGLTNGLYMIEVSTDKQHWTERVQVYK